jgi:hypothetical protein
MACGDRADGRILNFVSFKWGTLLVAQLVETLY